MPSITIFCILILFACILSLDSLKKGNNPKDITINLYGIIYFTLALLGCAYYIF